MRTKNTNRCKNRCLSISCRNLRRERSTWHFRAVPGRSWERFWPSWVAPGTPRDAFGSLRASPGSFLEHSGDAPVPFRSLLGTPRDAPDRSEVASEQFWWDLESVWGPSGDFSQFQLLQGPAGCATPPGCPGAPKRHFRCSCRLNFPSQVTPNAVSAPPAACTCPAE